MEDIIRIVYYAVKNINIPIYTALDKVTIKSEILTYLPVVKYGYSTLYI